MWPTERLTARRAVIDATPVLRRLRDRLTALLTPLLQRPLYVPERKAMLSRDGGVCPDDGARLAFDPLAPFAHGCPRCGRVFSRECDHVTWVWRYQVWLSERAVHLSLLAALGGSSFLADRAAEILGAYATRYRAYPNCDNVLGPSRLFFSTYLESIWLTQIVIAAALLERLGRPTPVEVTTMVEESAEMIASFDEGFSNRQVWNAAALCAAGILLGSPKLRAAGLDGPHGVRAQLSVAVTADGHWFEGENYHFFALRGLHLAGEIVRGEGEDPLASMRDTLARMFVAPLDTLLPDLTLPARGDAPFDVTVRQVRFAELWELARACGAGPRAEAILAAIYADDQPAVADAGVLEVSEQETNRAPGRIDRGGLGWKALLWMLPTPPASGRWDAGRCVLREAGAAVLRPGAGRYVSLECGGRPGGHGHPDLLHLTVFSRRPLLADMGTGSYVHEALHWYRSTLAHNAPRPAGLDQQSREGSPDAIDSVGDWSWVQATARGVVGPSSAVRRSVVCGPEWILDVVDLDVPDSAVVELPLHPLSGIAGLPADRRLTLDAGAGLAAYVVPRPGEAIDLAEGPGPPDRWLGPGESLGFLVRRAQGPGRWIQAYELSAKAVEAVTPQGDAVAVRGTDGSVTTIGIEPGRATVRPPGAAPLALAGRVEGHTSDIPHRRRSVALRVPCHRVGRRLDPHTWESAIPTDAISDLGSSAYRRSERAYDGRFRARVATFARGTHLGFAVRVVKPDVCFRSPGAGDPRLDNETADIHSDGVQVYAMLDAWHGWLVIPVPGTTELRVSPVRGLAQQGSQVGGRWSREADGYALVVEIEMHRTVGVGETYAVNVVVNEMYSSRKRRAGQLALAGGGGWVYLRGDRESPLRAAVAEVV